MTQVISMLRAQACGKWPAPIDIRSPSPPIARTVRSGLASFMPVAIGRERPWTPWKPKVLMKYGVRLEQPMPETTTTSFRWSWREASAL